MAYETFDIDLREGKAREDAFVHVFLRSKVEHKRDRMASSTGNHAVEMKQKNKAGDVVPSGVYATSAETWAVEYAPSRWLVLPIDFVRQLCDTAIVQGRTKWIGDGGNHFNALIPLEWFLR